MDVLRVNLKGQPYDILVGADLLPCVGDLIRPLRLGPHLGLVTHPALAETYGYGKAVVSSLRAAGFQVSVVTASPGEGSKSLDVAARLSSELVRAGMDRGSAILALGGGVVGDLAGFVAATLFRGIAFVNIPTTLLAQVDSSVGGKTAVNLPEGKNLVGAFYQPRAVLADVLTLRTLAEREFRSGLAEVVKHAVIADAELFRILEEESERILERDPAILQAIVARNCAIKARIVEVDEREAGMRAVLNFGHTVGHAIEAAAGYGQVTHGEGVACGMLAATALSVRRGICPAADARRLEGLVRRLDLLPGVLPPQELLETYILRDKKVRNGVIQFVLTPGIGGVRLQPVSDLEEVRAALAELRVHLQVPE